MSIIAAYRSAVWTLYRSVIRPRIGENAKNIRRGIKFIIDKTVARLSDVTIFCIKSLQIGIKNPHIAFAENTKIIPHIELTFAIINQDMAATNGTATSENFGVNNFSISVANFEPKPDTIFIPARIIPKYKIGRCTKSI